LLHGVHHLGIERPAHREPGASTGWRGSAGDDAELQDLADYRVTAKTIDVIGGFSNSTEHTHEPKLSA